MIAIINRIYEKICSIFTKLYHNSYIFTGIITLYVTCISFWLSYFRDNAATTITILALECLLYFIINLVIMYGIFCIGLLFKHYKIYYCIIIWFCTIYSIVNYYIVHYRGVFVTKHDFTKVDYIMAGTGNYKFEVNYSIIASIILSIFFTIVVILYKPTKQPKKIPIGIVSGVILLSFFISTPFLYKYISTHDALVFSAATPNHYHAHSLIGPYLHFYFDAIYNNMNKPNDYNAEEASHILDKYSEESFETKDNIVIVILNESWANLNHIGQLDTNIDVFETYNSLNAYKGYVTVSQYGGYTCNAEFEFLTGNNMYFLPNNSCVYTEFIKDNQNSIVSYLNQNNFKTIAFSICHKELWNIGEVYKAFNFNEMYFRESFDPSIIEDKSKYTATEDFKDIEVFKLLTENVEKQTDNNLFYFVTTMQNHMPYDNQEDVGVTITDSKFKDDKNAQTYVNLLKETDDGLKYLTDYFRNSDKNVTIVMFGDHYPFIEETVNTLYNGTNNSVEDMTKVYQTPFIIWNNRKDLTNYNDEISLCYLSNELFKCLDIPLSKNQQEMEYIRQTYPIISAIGYKKDGIWTQKPISVTSVDDPILHEYWCNQYYHMTNPN